MNGVIVEENFFDRLEKDIKQIPHEDHQAQHDQKAVVIDAVFEQDRAGF